MQLVIIFICTLFIFLLWIYTDPRPVKERFSAKMLEVYSILLVVVVPQLISFLYFQLPESKFDFIITFTGNLFFILGLALNIWSRLTLNKYWGPPGIHDTRRQTNLITKGPYKYSRNPIYRDL